MNIITEVTTKKPCEHCKKPDWCYEFKNGSSVCNRDQIGAGWVDSGKRTKTGHAILYPESWEGKAPEPKVIHTDTYFYNCRDGIRLVKVIVSRFDNGKKTVYQQFSNGKTWLKKRPESWERQDCHIYRYSDIRKAIALEEVIFIVEGEKCADRLWQLGLCATTNLGGVNGFSRSDAQDLIGANQIVLVPDRDTPGLGLMQKWAELFPNAQWLYPYPAKDWVNLPPDNGMDIYDWITDFELKRADLLDAIAQIPESLKPKEPSKSSLVEITEDKPKKNRNPVTRYSGSKNLNSKELLDFVDSELGDRLSFDEFRCKLYLDGKELKLGTDIEFWFLREFGESATDKKIYNAIVNTAKENSYHSVKLYLENCRKSEPVSIKDLATRYFGQSDPIYNLMVELWLISAIARAFNPGCQVDHCLVLQGGQGKGKTTWLNTLFGDFFTNSITKDNFGTPNSIMTCHVVWCAELGEIDSILKSKEAGLIKSFITTREDFMRKPYLREVDNYPRPCIFAGTVNPKRFLQDDENRRFWPIPIDDDFLFDLPLLEKERDGIFHSALLAYESGQQWWPNSEQKEAIAQILNQFLDTDAWLDLIEGYLVNRTDGVSIMQVLTDCLGFPEKDCKRAEQNRVSRILTYLGWTVEGQRKNKATGGVERIRKPKLKLSSKTSVNSVNSVITHTEQGFQNGGSVKDVLITDGTTENHTTGKAETLTQQESSHYSRYSHSFPKEKTTENGNGKISDVRDSLVKQILWAFEAHGFSLAEGKQLMGDLYGGRTESKDLTNAELQAFNRHLREMLPMKI